MKQQKRLLGFSTGFFCEFICLESYNMALKRTPRRHMSYSKEVDIQKKDRMDSHIPSCFCVSSLFSFAD